MPYNTNTFLFHVPNNYFSPHKVIQPFFILVEYKYQRVMFVEVTNITISVRAMGVINFGHSLKQEIEDAARQHHTKNFQNPDDLSGVLNGMPQGKNKR